MDAAFAPPPDDKFCFDVSAFSASNFAPAAFVGKLRADGVDLTKLRADLTRHHAALTKSYQASLRAELPQLAKLTGALGATDAELRRLCDRLAAHEEAASEHAAESASRLAAADAKRAEHAALAARAAQLRVLQRFADSLRTLEWLLGRARRDRPQGPRGRRRRWWGAARRRRASSATPSGCCARGASSAASNNCARAARRSCPSRRPPRAPTRAAPLSSRNRSCLAAALHLGAKAEKPIYTGPALDVLHGLADAGCADDVQRWVRSDWVAPTLGPEAAHGGRGAGGGGGAAHWRLRAARARTSRRTGRRSYLTPISRRVSLLSTCSPRHFGPKSSTSSLKRCRRSSARESRTPSSATTCYWRGCRRRWRGGSHGAEQLQAFREAPHTAALAKRWSLPIYYQLRAKHITEALDAAAAAARAHRRRRRRRGARARGGGRAGGRAGGADSGGGGGSGSDPRSVRS